ncbi:MAG: hypothetical protein CV090_12405 [Nitrospira sp. WS238]|nr:hypothetical protein [Nitrospira sp. WS238]
MGLVLSLAGSSRGVKHVALIAADILSTLSGPPEAGGPRSVRESSPPDAAGSRKSFSSVLRSVRGEVDRTAIREADGTRSAHKADERSNLKETKGLNGSTQPESSSDSSQATEKTIAGDKNDRPAGDTRTSLESSAGQNELASGSQDPRTGLISSPVAVSVQSQDVDQPDGQAETTPHLVGDEADGDASAQHPLIPHESSESFGTAPKATDSQLSTKNTDTSSSRGSTQQLNPSEPHTNHEGSVVQTAEQGTEAIHNENGKIVGNRNGHSTEYKDSIAGSPLSPHDPNVPQAIQAQAGKVSLQEKVVGVSDGAMIVNERPIEPLTPIQPGSPPQALENHAALSTNLEQSFSQGGQPDNGRSWQLSELWASDHGSQTNNTEPMIQPSPIVDHPIAPASGVGSVAVGTTSQIHPTPGTPAPMSSDAHAKLGVPAENMVQAAGIPVTKSVVVNVAQPDLGNVNIRVAMTHDVVHTHFSSDRLEVGQFLINSQERLQTALQSSGMDMGQFRVDIDRQGAGRSFQQGASHEQSQSWSHGSQGMRQDAHSDQHDQSRGTLHGLLNVVA